MGVKVFRKNENQIDIQNMGRVNEIWMENEHAIHVLASLKDLVMRAGSGDCIHSQRIPEILYLIDALSSTLTETPTYNSAVLEDIIKEIGAMTERLSVLLKEIKDNDDTNNRIRLNRLLMVIGATLSRYTRMLREKTESDNLNSVEFYRNRLNTLKNKVNELELEKKQNDQKSKQKDEELQRLSLAIKEEEKKIEAKGRQEDAQSSWNKKIEEAFQRLNEYQKPLLAEKNRLVVLFWVFGVLSVAALVLVVLAIYMAGHKIYSAAGTATLASYLPYYSPIPMIGVLLWVFIVQMNREQRQLIVLTQHLHNLSYTEGLLKSINIFAPGIEDAVSRINTTVDKLLDNHLSLHPALILKEESLSRSDKNQGASISEMTALLKEIRELVR